MTPDDLARALCDSSSHLNTLPHAAQRPCAYHQQRAAATLAQLERRPSAEARALHNVLLLALKIQRSGWRPEYAGHLMRFCREGGVEPNPLRSAL